MGAVSAMSMLDNCEPLANTSFSLGQYEAMMLVIFVFLTSMRFKKLLLPMLSCVIAPLSASGV